MPEYTYGNVGTRDAMGVPVRTGRPGFEYLAMVTYSNGTSANVSGWGTKDYALSRAEEVADNNKLPVTISLAAREIQLQPSAT